MVLDPALYWLIIGVLLLFLELALPGFILFFFGLGALITALAAWLIPLSIASQLALFIVASLLCLVALRKIIQRRFNWGAEGAADGSSEVDEDRMQSISGEKGVVSTTIDPPAEGRIKYAGTYWRATAEERIEEGEIIVIVKQNDLVIQVEKV
jgi:membrane protein implicated in regulation of membrane protease activity